MKLIWKESETPLFKPDLKLQIVISFDQGNFQLNVRLSFNTIL